MDRLKIQYKPIESLAPYEKNARTHTEEQIKQIVESIKEFGWTNPILIDEKSGIIAGHARLGAAKLLGYIDVPCIDLTGLSDAQRRAYIIADNKLALNAGWDEKLLAMELSELKDLDYDLGLIGFDSSELNELFTDGQLTEPGEADDIMPDGGENILIRLSIPSSVWIGKRDEIIGVLEKMEKLYLCQKSVSE